MQASELQLWKSRNTNPMNQSNEDDRPLRVVVTDVDISLGNLINLLVKLSLAVIPAAIITAFFFFALYLAARALFAVV